MPIRLDDGHTHIYHQDGGNKVWHMQIHI